ncbi:MFS transporter [Gottfriedia acidiceleris]|uniref:MFS transporter n=1 Tax=Bacillaceae TaxID=186817 RepID=UPI000BEE2CE4|nr:MULTISPECIES: MFS transporter [unclassified Bacillus (in: firmicutes)]PEC49177.1 MFS transporter [Bacillus sp. AFS096315]PFM75403.1 MFS transporter [Bacillus sp. AFS077874]
MKTQYIGMTIGLYINYFLLGMINIIFSSNMSFLTAQLNTDNTGISFLVSGIGIGKLITLSVSGRLSDKYGRKPLVITASFLYLLFLIGIPLAPTYEIAFIIAIIAGVSNSILDSGAYPALIEAFPKNSGISTVLIKASISIGAMIFPILISFIINHNIFYGYSFFILAFIFFINGTFLSSVRFPKNTNKNNEEIINKGYRIKTKPNIWLEGLATIFMGFTTTTLFMVVQVWLPTYGLNILEMSRTESIQLLSYFNIGSLISVLILAIVINRFVSPILILILYPFLTSLSLLVLLFSQQPILLIISSFLIGFSTAGLFQLCITVIIEFFPKNKATISAYVSTASSSAFIVIPYITGLLVKNIGVTAVFWLDFIIAIISIILATYVYYRHKKVFKKLVISTGIRRAS